MSWYPLPVAKFPTAGGLPGASPSMPFGLLPHTITQPLLPMSAAYATGATQAAEHGASHKRPFDSSAPQNSGVSAPSAAYASKFARSSDDASAPRGGGGLGRGRGRGGMRGGMRGGRAGRDADPPAPAAVVPLTPGFLADGRPDLSMYLTQPKSAASTPATQAPQSRAPPPAYAAAAAASTTAADGSAAAVPAAAASKPIYCQTYMQNLCFLRSCDAKDDDTDATAGSAVSAAPPSAVGRCEFVHDPEFRRTYLARNQWRATTWSQNRKSDAQAHSANRRHAPQRHDDEAPPKDGKLSGLKAPVKEDALLRKLLVSELRVESSRVLQAIRFLVDRDCLANERSKIKQKQQEAEEQHRRSKQREKEEEEREKQEAERQRTADQAAPVDSDAPTGAR